MYKSAITPNADLQRQVLASNAHLMIQLFIALYFAAKHRIAYLSINVKYLDEDLSYDSVDLPFLTFYQRFQINIQIILGLFYTQILEHSTEGVIHFTQVSKRKI
jgi:hypothetical protein